MTAFKSLKPFGSPMSRLGFAAGTLLALWAADHYYNYDHFTDALLAMLSQMRHSFG